MTHSELLSHNGKYGIQFRDPAFQCRQQSIDPAPSQSSAQEQRSYDHGSYILQKAPHRLNRPKRDESDEPEPSNGGNGNGGKVNSACEAVSPRA
jgi:hypothetical protein